MKYNKLQDSFIPPECPESFPQHLLRHDQSSPGVGGETVDLLQDITVALYSHTNILAHHGLRPGRLQGPLHLPGQTVLHVGDGDLPTTVATPDRTDQLHGGPTRLRTEDFGHIIRQLLSCGVILLAGWTLTGKPVVFLESSFVEKIQI